MAKLLEAHIPPESIVYVTGELIDDHHSLVRILTGLLNEMPDTDLNYILLDEVTYVNNWDKGIKYLADAGMLEQTVLVITGSDLVIAKEARMRFPGRRGLSDEVDFHLCPLRSDVIGWLRVATCSTVSFSCVIFLAISIFPISGQELMIKFSIRSLLMKQKFPGLYMQLEKRLSFSPVLRRIILPVPD